MPQMGTTPSYVSFLFLLTVLLAIVIFYHAAHKSKMTLTIISAWLFLQGLISLTGFYKITVNMPPRAGLLILPPLILIIILFTTSSGKKYIEDLDIKTLTILHTIRLPVEIVLFCLFLQKAVPKIMTFEGRNFDMISGLTAPLIYFFGFHSRLIGRWFILCWNIICLGLLINIVTLAVFSAPFPFQKFAFDQPNVALWYFPYVWLPCGVVLLILFSHLASIRKLLKKKI